MRIITVHVTHFRSIRNASFSCDRLVTLVGRNGTGKSSFLEALKCFFDPAAKLSSNDFFASDEEGEVRIALTFSSLTQVERDLFSPYLVNDTFAVTKVFSHVDMLGTYHARRLQNPDFELIRAAGSKTSINTAYRQFLADAGEPYAPLSPARSADEVARELANWEAANPDACEYAQDDGHFFSPSGPGGMHLERYIRFIRIPAVREAQEDAIDRRGSGITEIMDLIVRRELESHPDVVALNNEIAERYDSIFDPYRREELSNIQRGLTATLNRYAPNAGILLDWADFNPPTVPMPTAQVTVMEDSYATPVERAGHGVQRAFILTMLQHLTMTRDRYEANRREPSSRVEVGNRVPAAQPTVFLAIEEPELYQHPSRQRHMAAVLARLAEEGSGQEEQQTQIFYTTHAPLMVGLDRIDQLKLLRKRCTGEGQPGATVVTEALLDEVAEKLWLLHGKPTTKYSAATLRPRMQALMTPWMNEGFFADVVVLVEGDGDRAAILAVSELLGYDCEALGICVVPCGGKNSLDRPALVFREFGIPTYVVWDNDCGADERNANEHKKANRRLLRLMGAVEEDWPSGVAETHACVDGNLESTLRREITDKIWNEWLHRWSRDLSMEAGQGKKNAEVLRRVIKEAANQGYRSETLEGIVDAVLQMHPNTRVS